MSYCGIVLLHIYINSQDPHWSTLVTGVIFCIFGFVKKKGE